MAITKKRVLQHYVQPGHPTAFSAPDAVARHYKDRGLSSKDAKEILEHNDAYVLHREYKRPKVFNPYFIYTKRDTIQSDLIDIRQISRNNDGVNYLLLLIDIFTRKVWVLPLQRKTSVQVRDSLQQWLNSLSRKPKTIETDAGREYCNHHVRSLLQSNNINHKIAVGTCKAAFAERANKTIQILIYKFLTEKETLRYIDELENLVKTYNRRGHRSLQYLTPNEAERPANQPLVRSIQLLRFRKIKKRKPVYKLGDVVRLKTDAKQIVNSRRAYAEQFKGEFFVIRRINTRLPIPLYFVQSMDTNDHIEGGFYANELTRVRGDIFKIDHVIAERGRGRNRQLFVRWKYFGPHHDSWIYARDIVAAY